MDIYCVLPPGLGCLGGRGGLGRSDVGTSIRNDWGEQSDDDSYPS